jgi:hypothetical protein
MMTLKSISRQSSFYYVQWQETLLFLRRGCGGGSVGHYLFQYEVTNLDQGSGWPQGFDGFYIQVPLSATILNITNPPPYLSGGYPAGYWNHYFGQNPDPNWGATATLQPGYQWLNWWGLNERSVYPQCR